MPHNHSVSPSAIHLPIWLRKMERILVASLLLSACTAAPIPQAAHPSIVSLNPCTDAILAEVADPAQILALSRYSSAKIASVQGLRLTMLG